MKLVRFSLFITFFLSCQYAVIIDPVVDCTAEAEDLHEQMLHIELTEKQYNPRCYQLLCNEIVSVVAWQDDKVLVEVPHIYYYGSCRRVLQGNSFWICKESICLLDDIHNAGLEIAKIPPITQDYTAYHEKVVALVYPFYDPVTQKIYSAGTRFVLAKEHKKDHFIVYIFDSRDFCFQQTKIPKDHCLLYQEKDSDQKKDDFIIILKKWAHLPGGYIPYVWGGSSFCYVLQEGQNPPDWVAQCGFDCSCLISRAAQIAGLPYVFKNSTTLEQCTHPLKQGEPLQKGDIIWFEGHVMVVSDVEQNLIIEARGYGAGFGRVHEIHISKLFQNMADFADLLRAYTSKQPLWLLHADGTPRVYIKEFKIFSLKQLTSMHFDTWIDKKP